MAASRMLLVSAVMAAASIAQDQALERVKTESAKQRQLNVSDFFENYDLYRTRFHTVIRDWIETQLPKSKTALETKFSSLPARINGELHREGLISPDNREPQIGFLAHIRALRPPDDSNELAVTVGIDVPCGYDDAVYVYDYSQGPPRRVLQRYGTREHDESIAAVLFSKRDATGRQLILTLRYAVQCGSSLERAGL